MVMRRMYASPPILRVFDVLADWEGPQWRPSGIHEFL